MPSVVNTKRCSGCGSVMDLKIVTYPWGDVQYKYVCQKCGKLLDTDKVMPDIIEE